MSKGAMWNKWDLHIHSPVTTSNNEFEGKNIEDKWDRYIEEIEKLDDVKVLGITDYYSIDGYLHIIKEKKQGRMENIDLILPNIELRLNINTKDGRPINYHLIINPDIVDNVEGMILSNLKFKYQENEYNCTRHGLINLGRAFRKDENLDEEVAYKEGVKQFKVDLDDIKKVLSNKKIKGNVITVVANSNKDGNSGIQYEDSLQATRDNIYYFSDMIFSSNSKDRAYFLGKKGNIEDYLRKCGRKKPCIHGSDAHSLDKLCKPDEDRYTWIKAETTFNGLKQILNEPEDRVFIGDKPEILLKVKEKPLQYIDRLVINSISTYDKQYGIWFDNIDIPFSHELTAIIGNKGNGKSALVDIIGLLGNSKNKEYFSFLNETKFKKDKGKLSKQFEATLYKAKDKEIHKNLNEEINEDYIETIKYIPQSFFEKVTNNTDKSFEDEIKKVIFSHMRERERTFSSFDEIIEEKTKIIKKTLDKKNSELKEINRNIIKLEEKMSISYKKNIENKIKEKIEKIKSIYKPKEIKKPESSNVDKLKIESLELKSKQLNDITNDIFKIEKKLKELNNDLSKLQYVNLNIEQLDEDLKSYKQDNNYYLGKFGIKFEDLVKIEINTEKLTNKIEYTKKNINENEKYIDDYNKAKDKLKEEITKIKYELEGPNREYQKYLEELEKYEELVKKQTGDKETPDTLLFYEAELEYISEKLNKDLQENRKKRKEKYKEIYLEKEKEVRIYKDIKDTIDKFISDNKEYLNEFKISLNAGLNVNQNFYERDFFDYINGRKPLCI